MTTPGGPFDQAVAAELAKMKQDTEDLADALFAPLLDLLHDLLDDGDKDS